MKTEGVHWKDWDAVRCVARECEMVVGVSAGQRILSLRRGAGPDLLYQDTTDFRVGDWRLYGGHRFTVAPEGEGTYAPDNAPGIVETREQERAHLDTTTKLAVDSLSPRRRSGERVRERRFQKSATIRWNEPLSPAPPHSCLAGRGSRRRQ